MGAPFGSAGRPRKVRTTSVQFARAEPIMDIIARLSNAFLGASPRYCIIVIGTSTPLGLYQLRPYIATAQDAYATTAISSWEMARWRAARMRTWMLTQRICTTA